MDAELRSLRALQELERKTTSAIVKGELKEAIQRSEAQIVQRHGFGRCLPDESFNVESTAELVAVAAHAALVAGEFSLVDPDKAHSPCEFPPPQWRSHGAGVFAATYKKGDTFFTFKAIHIARQVTCHVVAGDGDVHRQVDIAMQTSVRDIPSPAPATIASFTGPVALHEKLTRTLVRPVGAGGGATATGAGEARAAQQRRASDQRVRAGEERRGGTHVPGFAPPTHVPGFAPPAHVPGFGGPFFAGGVPGHFPSVGFGDRHPLPDGVPGGRGPGAGMHVGPDHPLFAGRGGVSRPPGARFSHIGPFNPGNTRRGFEDDDDDLPPGV